MDIRDIVGEDYHGSPIVLDAIVKADSVINNPNYKTILCSVSGGSDSDLCVALAATLDTSKKVKYAFFNSGLEYQATLDHLNFLEKQWGIEIQRTRPELPIPLAVSKYGQPVISKFVSEALGSLQRHGFNWEDISYEEMIARGYPKGYSAFWTNHYQQREGCEHLPKQFNINYNKLLKEYIMSNPPSFPISEKCCKYVKKRTSSKLIKEFDADVLIMGIRKSESGVRSKSYKSCFMQKGNLNIYLPCFWMKDSDKREMEQLFNITHSRLYTEYGFRRSGCVLCSYNLELEKDMETVKKYEPKLYAAACNVFKEAHEWTIGYHEFKRKMGEKE